LTRIAVIDYGMGNLRSVAKALERAGAQVEVEARPGPADGLVLPGVGAFPKAMERVRELGLDRLIGERVAAGVPVLGICLGMQLLFERSEELGGGEGLGILGGEVRRLPADGLKLPHIGWEPVRWEREGALCGSVASGTAFYFVHSFAPVPADPADALGTAVHGERFVCAVERGSVFGFQFHPEKSSAAGLALLAAFVEACR